MIQKSLWVSGVLAAIAVLSPGSVVRSLYADVRASAPQPICSLSKVEQCSYGSDVSGLGDGNMDCPPVSANADSGIRPRRSRSKGMGRTASIRNAGICMEFVISSQPLVIQTEGPNA